MTKNKVKAKQTCGPAKGTEAKPYRCICCRVAFAVVQKYSGLCFYCGRQPKGILEIEHRTPISRGGSNNISNIVPACKRCNQRKGTKTEPEFLIMLFPALPANVGTA